MPPARALRSWIPVATMVLLLAAPLWALAGTAPPTGDPPVQGSALIERHPGDRHLTLRATIPEADSTVTEPPPEVRLIFSEPPQIQGTTVRLVDENEELVPTTAAAADEEDPREVFIRPDEPLIDGRYTVIWRTIAQDGHAQNGSFQFSVQIGR